MVFEGKHCCRKARRKIRAVPYRTFNSEFLTDLGFGGYDLDEIIEEYDRCAMYRNNHCLIEKYVRNSGKALDHMLALIPEKSDILDLDQYNIHQVYGNLAHPIIRGGGRTWASTIQFLGKEVETRDVNYSVGHFSRLKDICRLREACSMVVSRALNRWTGLTEGFGSVR